MATGDPKLAEFQDTGVTHHHRVRPLSRNGTAKRAEVALKNRERHFVIDGDAVVLGLDGISDFNALHSHKRDHEVQFYAFDMLADDGDDIRRLRLAGRVH